MSGRDELRGTSMCLKCRHSSRGSPHPLNEDSSKDGIRGLGPGELYSNIEKEESNGTEFLLIELGKIRQ